MKCLVCFYFVRVIAKPSSIYTMVKIIQDRAEITATIKLDDTKHLNINRKRSAIYTYKGDDHLYLKVCCT